MAFMRADQNTNGPGVWLETMNWLEAETVLNDASVIENLYRMRIDSVITDFPSMAVPLVAALER